MKVSMRKILLWTLLLVLMAGLVCAGANLLGQANTKAADAGGFATDMEMVTLDSIKKPTNNSNINWAEINPLDAKLKSLDAQYKSLVRTAGAEKSVGGIREETRTAGMALAQEYNAVAIELAAAYKRNNCITRGDTVLQLGKTRLANAEMTFNDLSSERIEAYNAEQDKLRQSQKAYLAENDLSAADKIQLRQVMNARAQSLNTVLLAQVQDIMNLILEVKKMAGTATNPAAMAGCAAKSAATGGNPFDNVANLLSPLQALLALSENMASNLQGMSSDFDSL